AAVREPRPLHSGEDVVAERPCCRATTGAAWTAAGMTSARARVRRLLRLWSSGVAPTKKRDLTFASGWQRVAICGPSLSDLRDLAWTLKWRPFEHGSRTSPTRAAVTSRRSRSSHRQS